jgi:hypothetical protein
MKINKLLKLLKNFKDFLISQILKRVSSKKKFELIYKYSYWQVGKDESLSGAGSSLKSTFNLRKNLVNFFLKENIRSILDIPCGDFNWFSKIITANIFYTGADIVEVLIKNNNFNYKKKNIKFELLNIISSKLKTCDLIFTRDCFVHLDNNEIKKAIKNIKKSNSKFFATTIFTKNFSNVKSKLPDKWRPINLCKSPFNLPNPKYLLDDSSTLNAHDKNKKIAIWFIKDL